MGLGEGWLLTIVVIIVIIIGIPNRRFVAVRNPYGLLPFRHLPGCCFDSAWRLIRTKLAGFRGHLAVGRDSSPPQTRGSE